MEAASTVRSITVISFDFEGFESTVSTDISLRPAFLAVLELLLKCELFRLAQLTIRLLAALLFTLFKLEKLLLLFMLLLLLLLLLL